jgi:hypothetical protein
MAKRNNKFPVVVVPDGKLLLSANRSDVGCDGIVAVLSATSKQYEPGQIIPDGDQVDAEAVVGILVQSPGRAKALSDWFEMLYQYMTES